MKTNKKDTKQGVVPALRFPEFSDTEVWVYLEGDKVFEQISNRKHSSNLPILAISQEHGAVPRNLIDYKVIVSDEGLENYKVVEIGEFIISLRSFQGGIEYSEYKGICSPAYIILRKRLDVDNQFFKYYFKSRAFIRELNKNLEGIRDGKMVSYKQFSEILLPIPSIHNKKEQQKIAECLSSIDALIKATENKIDELKGHKKGLMQQLFPAEGRTVPQYRFPEFQKANGWKPTSIDDVADLYKGEQINKISLTSDGLYPVINGGMLPSGFLDKYNAPAHTITISEGGNSCGFVNLINTNFWCGGHCYVVNERNGIKKEFLYQLLKNEEPNLMALRVGSGLPNIQLKTIKKHWVLIPTSENEQQKIADCLSSIDDLIMAQTNRLEALKTHKKGLMQQLFPNINDVKND